MRQRIINRLLTASLILFIGHLSANAQPEGKSITVQDLKKELKSVSDKMEEHKSYAVRINYMSYEKGSEEIIHDRFSGYMKKDDRKFNSCMIGINSIQDENERIEVDTINKIIIIANPISDEYEKISPQLTDRLLEKAKSIRKNQGQSATDYEIEFDESMPILSYLIEVDNNRLIKKIDLLYNRKLKNSTDKDVDLRVRLAFTEWNLNPRFSNHDFSKDAYVMKQKDKYALTDKYSKFKLLDQRVLN